MMHGTLKREQGFTLVEILVYLAIFIIATAAAVAAIVNLTGSVRAYAAEQVLFRNATSVLAQMQHELRLADTINPLASTLEVSPGAISLLDAATTTELALVGSVLTSTKNGGDVVSLHNDSVTTDIANFYYYQNAQTELVRVRLRMSATVFGVTATETFETAAVLRGSYE